MRLGFLILSLLLTHGICISQIQDSTVVKVKTVTDTLVDSKQQVVRPIAPVAEADSVSIKALKDDAYLAEIDQKWREELYNNTLFDTIYKSVTELTYEEVDYPELHTDTLKKRLKR